MAAALVQYVVLRGDLARPPLSWPLGAVVAQGCHAALAAVHGYREHPDTGAYLEQGDAMTTVVLEAPDEDSLLDLAKLLKEKIHLIFNILGNFMRKNPINSHKF
ncbi:putative peptidyl-tRNA hydrolase PTRHD1 isoform X2 [Zonotrichia albicollis]|uniref:putative peptidyl-tRNA hydrolase PTRHD1 isoform X2 n=1 Tax=Zonotrichia albicollis TaxID=44394 RepID=UPI003D80BA49